MKIVLWKLGSLEHKIIPTQKTIDRFAEALEKCYTSDGERTDLVWDDSISVQSIEVDLSDEPTIDFILPDCTQEEIQEILDVGSTAMRLKFNSFTQERTQKSTDLNS
jgi:hypothetical protein